MATRLSKGLASFSFDEGDSDNEESDDEGDADNEESDDEGDADNEESDMKVMQIMRKNLI